jgi:hypothetical protein
VVGRRAVRWLTLGATSIAADLGSAARLCLVVASGFPDAPASCDALLHLAVLGFAPVMGVVGGGIVDRPSLVLRQRWSAS